MIPFPFYKYPEVNYWTTWYHCCLHFLGTSIVFSIVDVPFPPTVQQYSLFSTSLPTLIISSHFEKCLFRSSAHFFFDSKKCGVIPRVFICISLITSGVEHLLFFIFFFFNFYFIFKLYNIVLVLPNIEMNPPQVYMCSPS